MCLELTCFSISRHERKSDIGPTLSVKMFRRSQGFLHERALSHEVLVENPEKDLDLTNMLVFFWV